MRWSIEVKNGEVLEYFQRDEDQDDQRYVDA